MTKNKLENLAADCMCLQKISMISSGVYDIIVVAGEALL